MFLESVWFTPISAMGKKTFSLIINKFNRHIGNILHLEIKSEIWRIECGEIWRRFM